MTGYSPMFAPLALGDRSRIVLGQIVTSNHFAMLGIQPERGRLLRPSDDEPGAEKVVVISHQMWVREFGSRSDIVGHDGAMVARDGAMVGRDGAMVGRDGAMVGRDGAMIGRRRR